MFAEAMEFEAKGDSLREAGRFEDAIEAYRTSLRHCVQWNWNARACEGIREKIWAVQIDLFESFAAEPKAFSLDAQHPDAAELVAAKLWVSGRRQEAEAIIARVVREGILGSGEFLDRLADRWANLHHDVDAAEWLRAQASRLRGESLVRSTASH